MSAPSRTSRLPALLLLAFAEGQSVNMDIAAQRTGWTPAAASKALSNAKALGFIDLDGQRIDGKVCYQLTERGETKLAAVQALQAQLPQPQTLAEQALAAIGRTEAGSDSQVLAELLGVTMQEVDDALAPHVRDHRLVTCTVVRGEVRCIQYRVSSGSRYDWRTQAAATFGNYKADLAAPPAEPTPEVPPPSQETRTEYVTTMPGVSVAGIECSTAEEPFLCALYSDGVLSIESYGKHLELPTDHTRALLRFLAGLNASALLEAAA